jgi:hypothetical protein
VFCQTKATAEGMAKASDTRFYHLELPDKEKKNNLDSFRAGTGTFHVLYTMSALSAGLDMRDIQVVVYLCKPNSMLDYGQEFGHGCWDVISCFRQDLTDIIHITMLLSRWNEYQSALTILNGSLPMLLSLWPP